MNLLADDADVVRGLESSFRGLRGKKHLLSTIPKTRRLARAVLDDMASVAYDVAQSRDATFDLTVHHVSGAGQDMSEFLGVPSVLMCPQPYWVPTDAFPDPSFPWRWPSRWNKATYFASKTVWWAFSGSTMAWRRESLGLGRRPGGRYRQLDGSPTPVLHPFSEHLLPASTGYPPWVHTTGFWFLPALDGWSAPASLAAYLADGPVPVGLGFGSTVRSDPQRLGRIVRDAVRMAGVRAVVVGGSSGLTAEDVGDDVAFVNSVPFDWLFARVAAIVHHGGLGTTGTAMASGRPQVVCPVLPDQWFSARRMHALGVAPAPIPQRGLTAERLAQAIRTAMDDHRLATRAEEVGRLVRAEDGATKAVRVLESIVQERSATDSTLNWKTVTSSGSFADDSE